MKHITIYISLFLFLSGCATSYQPYEIGQSGYKETSVSKNQYRIFYYPDEFTSQEKAFQYALLRAAELTIQNKLDYFILVDRRNTGHDASFKKKTDKQPTVSIMITMLPASVTYDENYKLVKLYDAHIIYLQSKKSYLLKPVEYFLYTFD